MNRAQIAAALLLAVALAGCGGKAANQIETSGTISATEVSVATEVAGKVTDVLVKEGQKVQQGDPVAQLDTSALELLLKQAQGAQQAAEARLAEAQAGARPEQVRQAEESARSAAAARDGAQKNYDTFRRLYDQGAATRAQMDAATTQLETTTAQAQAAQAQANLVRQGATPEQIKQLEAGVTQARAAADLAKYNLDRATVKAPVSGVVLRRLAEPGTLVSPGGPIATVANLDDLWLRVFVPENQLSLVKLGLVVSVRVDPYPARTFKAEVIQIADKAEYTPRNVQTKQERSTTVYAVKLQLREGLTGELKPGMPADVIFQGQ
jgi:HlyD family secretion protein